MQPDALTMNLDGVAINDRGDAGDTNLGEPPTFRQESALRLTAAVIASQASTALDVLPCVPELHGHDLGKGPVIDRGAGR